MRLPLQAVAEPRVLAELLAVPGLRRLSGSLAFAAFRSVATFPALDVCRPYIESRVRGFMA